MSVGYGIVGLGRAAQRLAASMVDAKHAHIEAVCSADREKAASFADRFGATTIYARYSDMLADPNVNAVIIASVNAAHREHVLAAATAAKHVFCEKPLGCDMDDAMAMIDACETADVRFSVGYHHRFHPLIHRARELIAGGALGKVLLVRANFYVGAAYDRSGWRSDPSLAGGGALVSTGVHLIDTVNYMLGEHPKTGALIADNLPVEETCTFTLAYQSGTFAVFDTSRLLPVGMEHNDIKVVGSEGHLTLQAVLGGPIARGILAADTADGPVRSQLRRHLDLYAAELEDLALAIETGSELTANARCEIPVAGALRLLYENSTSSSHTRADEGIEV